MSEEQPKHYLEEGNTEAIVALSVRIRSLEKSLSYGNTMIENLGRDIGITNRTCVRIEQSFATYEPYLKESLQSQKFWAAVRDDCIKHVSKSALWAVIFGFCAALYYAARQAFKDLFNGS